VEQHIHGIGARKMFAYKHVDFIFMQRICTITIYKAAEEVHHMSHLNQIHVLKVVQQSL
jgi:hypothetical protein